MSYTLLTIQALRHQLFDQALAEYREETGNPNASPSGVSHILVEHRVQTAIMAGIGDTKPDEKKTSPELATLAARYMEHEDDNVRSLAASVLSQA
jgi:hypothetical protein